MAQSQPKAKRRYRGKTPEQLQAERHQRLLDAALDLFGTRGYSKSPIELICSTARVATRHFYEQFDGREALLAALYDDITQQAGERINAQLEDDATTLALRVGYAIQAAMLFLLEDPRRGRIVALETVGVSKQMEQHRRERLHALAAIVTQFAEYLAGKGELPERDYYLPGVGMVGLFNELIVEYLVGDTKLSAEEMAREAVILFRALITGARDYQPQ